LRQTGIFFIVTCLFNAAWLFAWHYGQWRSRLALIVLFLLTLILLRLRIAAQPLTNREKLFVRLPFSVYFGWLTIATIANATALFVAYGFSGLGLSESFWTIAILAVGAAIGIATALRFHDAAYLFVFLWAYGGHPAKSSLGRRVRRALIPGVHHRRPPSRWGVRGGCRCAAAPPRALTA
jgi:hypothetical protein